MADETAKGTTAKRAKRKRRIKSPHPGVKLKRRALPGGGHSWRAHWIDPLTGRETAVTLDPVELRTAEARTTWAKRKSEALARQRMELAMGRGPVEILTLDKAIKRYLEGAAARLRPKTIETQKLAIAHLEAWAKRDGVRTTADLNRARFAALREYLVALPRKASAAGGKRGERRATKRKRSAFTINRELASVKAIANTWRTQGLLVNVSSDDLSDALAALPTPREEPAWLRPAELQKLIKAALRHDEETYKATRAELKGKGEKGTTPRYPAVAPFLVTLLLTGMRRGEGLALRWEHIDLGALDHDGKVAGEIRLPASLVKTHRARTIGLEVCPAGRRILAAWKLAHAHAKPSDRVFPELTASGIESTAGRLVSEYGAPRSFNWQTLRSTCGTYSVNAPSVFGAASVFMSARRLGHSVQIAERHYLGLVRGIPREARTLEAAMQIEAELANVLGAIVTRPADRGAA